MKVTLNAVAQGRRMGGTCKPPKPTEPPQERPRETHAISGNHESKQSSVRMPILYYIFNIRQLKAYMPESGSQRVYSWDIMTSERMHTNVDTFTCSFIHVERTI